MVRGLMIAYVLVLVLGAAAIEIRIARTGAGASRPYAVPLIGWQLPLYEMDVGAVGYVAVRTLPKNHRLRAEDLRRNPRLAGSAPVPPGAREALVGKYLKTRIEMNNPVKRDDVQASPAMPATTGQMPLFFALRDGDPLADMIDVDWRVDVCRAESDCVVKDAPVFAVVCPPAAAKSSCFVGVEVGVADLRKAGSESEDPKKPWRVIPVARGS